VVVLKFRADDFDTAEEVVAKSGAPASRKVDCSTLRVVSVNPSFITPRERLLPTKAQGQTKLAHLGGGQFRYRWQTEADWVGTCRASSDPKGGERPLKNRGFASDRSGVA
jgi:hypothetical protein